MPQTPIGLDPELYETLRRRQKVRQQHTLLDVAATLKMGKRADYSGGFRRLQEKQAMGAPLVAQLGQLEQYYFGREFEARQNAMNQAISSSKAAMQAELSKMGVMAGSAQARSRNSMAALNRNMNDTQMRMDMLQEMSPMAQNFIKELEVKGLVRPGSQRGMTQKAAEGNARQVLQSIKTDWARANDPNSGMSEPDQKKLKADLAAHVQANGAVFGTDDWEDNYVRHVSTTILAQDHAEITGAAQSVAPGAPPLMDPRSPEIARMLGNIIQNQTDPAQQGSDVLGILNAIGVPSEEAVVALSQIPGGMLLARQVDKAIEANAMGKQQVEEDQGRNAAELEAVARRTFPDSKPLGAALDHLAQTTQQYTQAREQFQAAQAGGEPGAPGEEGTVPGAAPGEVGGPPPDERTQNFYDIVGDTTGSAPERFIRLMGAISDFEDLPPAAAMKAQIMGSDKLKEYMSSRGLKDPDTAFRLMNREARVIHRNNRGQDRKAMKKLRSKGVILSREADIERPETPAAPSAQATIADKAVDRAKASLAEPADAAQ